MVIKLLMIKQKHFGKLKSGVWVSPPSDSKFESKVIISFK